MMALNLQLAIDALPVGANPRRVPMCPALNPCSAAVVTCRSSRERSQPNCARLRSISLSERRSCSTTTFWNAMSKCFAASKKERANGDDQFANPLAAERFTREFAQDGVTGHPPRARSTVPLISIMVGCLVQTTYYSRLPSLWSRISSWDRCLFISACAATGSRWRHAFTIAR